MSGFPYGFAYQGGQPPPPPQQQQYPPYQPCAAYPPSASAFGTTAPQAQQPPHYPPPPTSYYANAQSAYDYNANSIPGLGTPSSATPFPAPYKGAWNQGMYGNGNGPSQAQYPAYSPPFAQAPTPATYPVPQAQASSLQASQPAHPIQPAQAKQQNKPAPKPQPKPQIKSQTNEQAKESPKPKPHDAEMQEDGEIDDGYFDDLYDDASKAPSVANDTAAVSGKVSGATAEDGSDQEPNFYDTDMEEVAAPLKLPAITLPAKTKNNAKLPDRDRSRSYSPHFAPVQVRGGQLPAAAVVTNRHAGLKSVVHSLAATVAVGPAPTAIPAQSNRSRGDEQTKVQSLPAAVNGAKTESTVPKPFASVSEAHNEAKKAILKLFPHGVKYQTYIDEGFGADVIKELFTQLNLPTGTPASVPIQKSSQSHDKEGQASKSQLPQPTQADTMAKKQEERKDRIARLLAEKQAQKTAKIAAVSSSTEPISTPITAKSTINAPTPPAKSSVSKAESNRVLQQKVEALRAKARESKKLAQKTTSTQLPNSDSTPKPQLSAVAPVPTQPPVAVQSASSSALSSAPQSATASPAIPALPLLVRETSQVNQRKRPVAADFMDYQAPGAKRPTLADRENSSFIISISDDEDDDVEMEVESATEDSPTPFQQPLNLPRRGGPSIRDFPPLKDFPNARQVSSPVSGMSASGTNSASADLQSKERAIQEMNRRIKELEARKQAKLKSGNVTPQSPGGGGVTPTSEQVSKLESPRLNHATTTDQALKTPMRVVQPNSDGDDKTTPSAQLLQEAEAASVPNTRPQSAATDLHYENDRRVRGPSAQISAKSNKALEKAARLKRMQEEMLRLQAEIEQDDDGDSVEGQDSRNPEPQVGTDVTSATQDMLASMVDEPVGPSGQVKEAALSKLSTDALSQLQSMDIDLPPTDSDIGLSVTAPSNEVFPVERLATRPPTPLESGKLPDTLSSATSQLPGGERAVIDLDESDDYEPPEPQVDQRADTTLPTVEPLFNEVDSDGAQLSGKVAETAREVHVGRSAPTDVSLTHSKAIHAIDSTRQTSFTPYKSPLRYYHAYRFHPNYNDGIRGGLKSLTYSNRIDPKKEMCPDEWEGMDCPRGSACQFQHFQSIVPPDSEIILELGSSDEFTGEKKKEFNNGLREVVVSFQKSKVKDFRTIAGAILDFRRRFLGDDSKVLRLEGVST